MGELIFGVDFKGETESRFWEKMFDKPKGSYRGCCDGIHLFEVEGEYASCYAAPDQDPA